MNIKILLLLSIVVLCLMFGAKREKLEMKKRKKVAIGICGQPRTFQKCYQSLYDYVINCNTDYEFDIYLVTWDKDYNEHKVELEECYPNHEKILLTNEDKENIDKIPENICNFHNHGNKSYVTQLYQWQKFINNINSSKYDIIMKTRFDINLLHKIKFSEYNDNYLILGKQKNEIPKYRLTDQIIIGNNFDMKKILNLYNNLYNNCPPKECDGYFNEEKKVRYIRDLENTLGYYIYKNNFNINRKHLIYNEEYNKEYLIIFNNK